VHSLHEMTRINARTNGVFVSEPLHLTACFEPNLLDNFRLNLIRVCLHPQLP